MEAPKRNVFEVTNGYSWDKLTIDTAADNSSEDMKGVFAVIMKFLTFWEQDWLEIDG